MIQILDYDRAGNYYHAALYGDRVVMGVNRRSGEVTVMAPYKAPYGYAHGGSTFVDFKGPEEDRQEILEAVERFHLRETRVNYGFSEARA